MSATGHAVVLNGAVIVPPQSPRDEIKFRWQPELLAALEAIARQSGRNEKEVAEMLMRWAVDTEDIHIPVHEKPRPVKYMWAADVIAKLKARAERTGRSENEVGEWLMREAVKRARAEFEQLPPMGGENPPATRKSKK